VAVVIRLSLTDLEARIVLLALAELGNAEVEEDEADLLDSVEAKIRKARRKQRGLPT
jgi:hypothetical protein